MTLVHYNMYNISHISYCPEVFRCLYAQSSKAQSIAQSSNTQSSNAQSSNAQSSNAQSSNAQSSNAQSSNAQSSNAKSSNAQSSNCKFFATHQVIYKHLIPFVIRSQFLTQTHNFEIVIIVSPSVMCMSSETVKL